MDNNDGHINRDGVSWAALGVIVGIIVSAAAATIWVGSISKQVQTNDTLLHDDRAKFDKLSDSDKATGERLARTEAVLSEMRDRIIQLRADVNHINEGQRK